MCNIINVCNEAIDTIMKCVSNINSNSIIDAINCTVHWYDAFWW